MGENEKAADDKKKRRNGAIKKSGQLATVRSPSGLTSYVCSRNQFDARLHPIFGSRKEARRHIMLYHLRLDM